MEKLERTGRWLADRAAEGLWQGCVMGAGGTATVTYLINLWTELDAGEILALAILASLFGTALIALGRALLHKKELRLGKAVMLADVAAAADGMKDELGRYRLSHSLDLLVVTGKDSLRIWKPDVIEAIRRDVTVRILLPEPNAAGLLSYASTIGLDIGVLRGELKTTDGVIADIRQSIPRGQEKRLLVAHFTSTPLYSMWINDSSFNLRVHLHNGTGEGPVIRGDDPTMRAILRRDFDALWDAATAPVPAARSGTEP